MHELVTVTAEFRVFHVTEKSGRLALNDDAQVRKPAVCCTETKVSGHEVLTVHFYGSYLSFWKGLIY